jgi:hypothetical protein
VDRTIPKHERFSFLPYSTPVLDPGCVAFSFFSKKKKNLDSGARPGFLLAA